MRPGKEYRDSLRGGPSSARRFGGTIQFFKGTVVETQAAEVPGRKPC
jgi:hypothetical protein